MPFAASGSASRGDEDPELPLTKDASNVRDLASDGNDRARTSQVQPVQLCSLADQYFGNRILDKPTAIPAVHPCR